MHVASVNSVAEAIRYAHEVAVHPDHIVGPRGLQTAECVDVTITHHSPGTDTGTYSNMHKGTVYPYLNAELAWYLTGDNRAETIGKHARLWTQIQNPDGTVNSAYGHTIWGRVDNVGLTQWDRCVKSLLSDEHTRQAVLIINNPDAYEHGTNDMPCTLSITMRIRDGCLDIITVMRSQDVWYGLPYDAPFFMLLQHLMTEELNRRGAEVQHGKWIHHVHSLHAYKRNHHDILECLRHPYAPAAYPLHSITIKAGSEPLHERLTGPLAVILKGKDTWRTME